MASISKSLDALALNVIGRNGFGSTDVQDSLRTPAIELNRNVGPTSILDEDTFKFSSISYPKDVTQDKQNGHYMLFYINVQNKTKYKYESAAGGNTKIGETVFHPSTTQQEIEAGTAQTIFKSYGDTDASYREGLIKQGGTGNILTSDAVELSKGRKPLTGFSSVLPTTTRITDSIAIYLPPNVQDSTNVEYEGVETGVIGMAAATGGQFIKDMQSQDYAGAVKNIFGSAGSLAKSAAINLGAKFIGGASELLLDVDAEVTKGFAHKAFGQATNPYMEVLFQNVGLRSFTYNFTFAPRNEDETHDVQKIIKMFRFHMLPELKGQNERYMTLPSTFDIHYMYQWAGEVDGESYEAKENNFYTKIATCVLKGVDVNYTPGGVRSFADGSPTQITMNLSFQETEMLTKQHVDKGY
jgi:hypothetical protein